MDLSPLTPLLAPRVAPLHPDGLGYDEFIPAALAVLIGLGVYTLVASGDKASAASSVKRPRRRQRLLDTGMERSVTQQKSVSTSKGRAGHRVPARRRIARMLLLFALLTPFFAAPGTRIAEAHAELARSEPASNTSLAAPPSTVRLWFTEEVEPSFTEATVLDKDGRRVDAADSRLDTADRKHLTVGVRDVPEGTYTVAWRALSAVDGHVTRGSFAFGVGVPVNIAPPDPYSLQQPDPAAVVVRWFNFAASTAVVGVFPFLLWVWLPVLGRLRPESTRTSATRVALRRALVVAGWGAGALALASVGLLIVQAAALYENNYGAALNPSVLLNVVTGTRNGGVLLARLVLIAMLGALLYQLYRGHDQRMVAHGPLMAGLALGATLLFTTSLTGHAGATGRAPAVNVVVDWFHLAGAATWVGGLVHLAAQLPLLAALERRDRTQFVLAAIPRFSTVALTAFAVLVATGLYGSVINIPDIQALRDTVYGGALSAKLQFMVVLGLIGLINLFVIERQFSAYLRGREKGADPSFRFWSLVMVEAILGMLVLLAAGVMTSIMPARQAVGLPGMRPLEVSAPADDLRIGLQVSPYEAGNNEIAVALEGQDGAPAEADRVTVRFTMQEHDMGQQEAVLTAVEDGRYAVQGSYLSMAGTWTAEVHVRRAGRDDAVVPFTFPVLDVAPGKLAANDVPDAGSLYNAPLVAGQLAVLGLVLALAAWRFGGATTRTGLVSLGLSGGFLMLAGFVGGSIQLEASPTLAAQTSGALLQNPIAPDSRSLEAGARLYVQNCTVCHGPRGRGDGPAAATLRPRPADLAVHVTQHPDGVLFTWISDGVPGTAMPAFRGRLSDEDRWHILNYVKSIATPEDR